MASRLGRRRARRVLRTQAELHALQIEFFSRGLFGRLKWLLTGR